MSNTLSASTLLAVPLAPLVGSLVAGILGTAFGGNVIGRRASHGATILGVLIAMILSVITLCDVIEGARFNATIYEWMVIGGLKMANGENPKGYGRRKQQAPFTRMKLMALQREQFIKAKEYQQKLKDAKPGEKPARDINLEPLVEVLEGKRTVHFHCHRADDIYSAIRLSQEFDFDLVLQHCTEGYLIAEEIAKAGVGASLTLVDSPGGKAETMFLIEENAAILEKAGVNVAINTDDFITESRFFLRTGSMAVRGGMSPEAALKALTINPAKMMHLDHRVGSLEVGKDADFVVLSGDPFSVYTQVLETYIDGERRFDRSDKDDWSYQAGGFALADKSELPDVPDPIKPLEAVGRPRIDEPGDGEKGVTVIRAGRVYTATGQPIFNGVIVIKDGKIQTVGKFGEVDVPKGGMTYTTEAVTPGLIDCHSVVGISGAWNIPADQDQDELSDPNQADLRVIDGFNVREPLLRFLRNEGVTVIHAMPGRANVLAGQTGIFRTKGRTIQDATIRFPAGTLVNLGEAPKAAYDGRQPDTRMGTALLVRSAFADAKAYWAKDEEKRGPKNLKAEALAPALKGEVPVIFSAHRADDIMTGLRLSEEFGLKPMVSLGTEAYLIADKLSAAKVPVLVHPTMQRSGASMETYHSFVGNAAVLAKRKVPVAVTTAFEGYVPKTRMLRSEMAVAMTHGLGRVRALESVTIGAARILGIEKEYGSIEPGKVADIVLYDGDPFENATHVTHTLMDGKVVYDRAEYLKMPFERRALPLTRGAFAGCCLGALK